MAKWIIRRDNLAARCTGWVGPAYLMGWSQGCRLYTADIEDAKRFPTKIEAFNVRGDGEVIREDQAEAEHDQYINGQ